MSFISLMTTAKADVSKGQVLEMALRKLPQFVIGGGLGLLGGAFGVMIAIALAIVVQGRTAPTTTYVPGIIPLAIVATLAGLGVSWLFGRGAPRILPSLARSTDEQFMQLVLICSVFASLLETFLFMRGF